MIVVLGANGMLGSTLMAYFQSVNRDCLGYTRKDFDAASLNVSSSLKGLQKRDNWSGATIVNAIGIIPQKNPSIRDYVQVNTLYPHHLSRFCEENGHHLIHITTDCVYSGRTDIGYGETDEHDEPSIYGVTKSCGEPQNAMMIRTSIIGEELSGKKSLLEWVRSQAGQEIKGFANHIWNGVTCLQLAKVLLELMDQNVRWTGIRHIVTQPAVNKFELVNLINEVYDLKCRIAIYETPTPVNHKLLPSQDDQIARISQMIPPLQKQIQETFDFHRSLELI